MGSLSLRCSFTDLNRDVEVATTPVSLPPYAIALIAICLVLSLTILIIVIFIIRKIRKITYGVGSTSFPLVENSNS